MLSGVVDHRLEFITPRKPFAVRPAFEKVAMQPHFCVAMRGCSRSDLKPDGRPYLISPKPVQRHGRGTDLDRAALAYRAEEIDVPHAATFRALGFGGPKSAGIGLPCETAYSASFPMRQAGMLLRRPHSETVVSGMPIALETLVVPPSSLRKS